MGAEMRCRGSRGHLEAEGKAQLESDYLRFSSSRLKFRIEASEIASMVVDEDDLLIESGGEEFRLRLGAGAAAKWIEKIRNPKSLLDKLGFRNGDSVAVIGVADEEFRSAALKQKVMLTEASGEHQHLLVFLESAADLAGFVEWKQKLQSGGGVWTVRAKGPGGLKESDVRAAALQAGLVDVKVASFSATKTAERFVIPKRDR